MSFTKNLAKHISLTLNLNVELSELEEAIDSFGISERSEQQLSEREESNECKKKSKVISNVKLPKTKNVSKEKEEVKTCERTKRGQKKPCGKPAKKFIESEGEKIWLCGTEKTGCYPVKLNEMKKVNEKKVQEKMRKSVLNSDSKVNVSENKKPIGNVFDKMVKLTKKPMISVISTEDENGNQVWIEKEKRYLFNKETSEIYGKLSEEGGRLELNDEDVKWIEGHNLNISSKLRSIDNDNDDNEEEEEEEEEESSDEESILDLESEEE